MIIAGFLGEDTAPAAAAAASTAPAAASAAPVAATPAVAATQAIVAPPAAAPAAPAAMPSGVQAVSRGTRDPFKRPAGARNALGVRNWQTGFVTEFQPFPSVMAPMMMPLQPGMRNPSGAGPAPALPSTALPADPSGQSSVPAGVPSPVKGRVGRLFPPSLIMAMGIMPPVRGVRMGNNPAALIAAGRKPAI
jgi:hypothetical protein